jgi:hypothetical protein
MFDANDFSGLRFMRSPNRLGSQVGWVASTLVMFTLVWLILPPAAVYWLLFLGLAAVSWVASYGWRPAMVNLIAFLQGFVGFE